jgi:PDZ domain-containing protein
VKGRSGPEPGEWDGALPSLPNEEPSVPLLPMKEMLPGWGGGRSPLWSRWPLRRLATAGVVLLLVANLAVLEFLHIPYYALSPGPTAAVSSLISVPKAKHHRVHGSLLLVTVYQTPLTPLGYLRAELSPDDQVLTAAQILGDVPASELQQEDEDEMTSSKEDAEVAALRYLGYPVTEHGTGALIGYVLTGTPAVGHLQAGDTVLAINGAATDTAAAVSSVLAHDRPGQAISLAVENSRNQERTVRLTLGHRPGSPGQPFIGVGLLTRNDKFDFPFSVSINSEGIGGPSAGLSFTLGLINELTTGRLTGGRTMAATGTMDPDGNVGDVGGVAQKTVAVSRAGASLFLVPPQEYATAKAHAGSHLEVVAVSTLGQALRAIAAHGGDLSGIRSASTAVR